MPAPPPFLCYSLSDVSRSLPTNLISLAIHDSRQKPHLFEWADLTQLPMLPSSSHRHMLLSRSHRTRTLLRPSTAPTLPHLPRHLPFDHLLNRMRTRGCKGNLMPL